MIALNTIVTDQLQEFKKDVDARIAKGEKKDEAILKEIQKMIKASKDIRFEGNGYGDEWVKEAKKRGLSNHKNTPRALAIWKDKNVQGLFERLNILSKEEVEARYEVELENYIMKRQIECRVCSDIANNHVIPAAVNYQNRLISNVTGIKEIFGDKEMKSLGKTQMELIRSISANVSDMQNAIEAMIAERDKVDAMTSLEKKSIAYAEKIKPMMDEIRGYSDTLEMLVDDEIWPMPKLRELLFTR